MPQNKDLIEKTEKKNDVRINIINDLSKTKIKSLPLMVIKTKVKKLKTNSCLKASKNFRISEIKGLRFQRTDDADEAPDSPKILFR